MPNDFNSEKIMLIVHSDTICKIVYHIAKVTSNIILYNC